MDYQTLHAKTVVELRKLARDMGVRVPAGTNKQVLVQLVLEAWNRPRPKDEAPARASGEEKAAGESVTEPASAPKPEEAPPTAESEKGGSPEKPTPRRRGRPPKARPEPAATDAAQKKTARKAAAKALPEGEAPQPARKEKASGRQDTAASGAVSKKEAAPAAQRPGNGESSKDRPGEGRETPAPVGRRPTGAEMNAPAEAQKGGESAPAPLPADGVPRSASTAEAGQDKPTPVEPDRPVTRRAADGGQPQNYTHPEPQREAAVNRPQGELRTGAVGRRVGTPQLMAHNGPVTRETAQRPRHGLGETGRAQAGLRPRVAEPAQPGTRPRSGEVVPSAARPRQAETVPAAVRVRPQEPAKPVDRPRPVEAAPADGEGRPRREGYYNAEYRTSNPAVPEMLAAGECGDGAGVLEIQPDGYGFLRAENCLPGPNDVYISIAQIRRFGLRVGDYVEGKTRPQREGDRYSAILYITRVNGAPPEQAAERPRFEDLVPVYPDQRLRLERPEDKDLSLRLVDLLAPIGKGQRGMIVSPPKAGKTTLLKKIANSITAGYPDAHLIVLLIDERPEEVTDMKRSIDGEVVFSTFDEMPENHTRVAEMVLERAQRLVEMGRDVVVLMDSITRLARAYNLVITPTGRSLSGGLDPGALFRPKRFFGAARNIENGGSLTIIATALVDTGSRLDDIIYEEFKGTGNMELHLDRKLSDRRVFPAIDLARSGTRREELLLSPAEQEGALRVRRMLGNGREQDMMEEIIDLMSHTRDNADFCQRLQGWLSVAGKDGFRGK